MPCFSINRREKVEVKGPKVPKVQWSSKKKKEEKRKLKRHRIVTAIDFYIVHRSFFIRSLFVLRSSSG